MPIQLNSPGWKVRRVTSRGIAGDTGVDLPGLPSEFLTDRSRVAEEVVLDPPSATRTRQAGSDGLDLSYDLEPGHTAILAIRQPSGALTFHLPVQSTSRGIGGPSQVRFQVVVRQNASRGLIGQAIKAIVVKVVQIAADKAVSLLLPRLAEALETAAWRKRGLNEGWLKVTRETLASGALESARPISPERSLLFVHGTFSNAASAYRALAATSFFDRIEDTYGDRIFAFDHFSVSRTPEQNARALLTGLPEQRTTFDVVTHSRGGLVLRNLVERPGQFGDLSRRFKLGRAVLVASPNDGTPLATPKRWDETVGWFANLLELFPDNPFTTGAAFVANGLVWLANHASGDLPGLSAMDGEGEMIRALQGPPGPPSGAYSALVANHQPTDQTLRRLLDVGIDQWFGSANDLVVPSAGGWRIDGSVAGFIPASRIGCFGPGGNLPEASVTHVSFFSRPETVDFLVNGLLGRQQSLGRVDPLKDLPNRRLLGRGMADIAGTPERLGTDVPAARAASAPVVKAPEGERLRITVTNGDLTFEREALLLGHYRATRLTGTEGVMDRMIGGAMGRSLDVGLYPLSVGSHQIFINTRPDAERGSFLPRPKAVIVVGLGEEGKLQAANLVQTVRLAVIAWAQRLAEPKKRGLTSFELATTLIASGGTGITPGEAARLVAQGVFEANVLLKDEHRSGGEWPHVSHLRFIELYLDRAAEAWRSLRMQEAATPGRYAIDDTVVVGTGPLLRPRDSGYRGANYDFITAETKPGTDGGSLVSYTLDTRRARSEVRGQRIRSELLRELVATASNDQNSDRQIGRTLFNLLIPVELEAYLTGSGEMQIELDAGTAPIPWELLDTGSDAESSQQPPWAIRVKLLRKLRTARFREHPSDADGDASALVVGEPECPPEYPRLYGARREADAVRACLQQPGALGQKLVKALISAEVSQIGPNAREVVNALFERPWRIVHIAGHGKLGAHGEPGGVVLSNGSFLGPDEIRNMRKVPELVFVNCCHLASGDAEQLVNYDRASFASGVAGALIEIGVRCVVAAGWAVDDDAASVFAETFYRSLLRGSRFIDAVSDARRAAYERTAHVNTWAAYQCYGDPDWEFRRAGADANQFTARLGEDFSGVASAQGLKLALERIVVETRFQGADPASQLNNLSQLEERFKGVWGRSGDVAELFGEAFVEAGDVSHGLAWYESAVAAPDGRASMKAAEQLASVRGRLAWEAVDRARRHLQKMEARQTAGDRTSGGRATVRRARADAQRTLRREIKRADRLIERALALLAKLQSVEETMERASLIGSCYKRRALVDAAAGRRQRMRTDLQQMKSRYRHAQTIGAKRDAADLYYPASNCLVADVALHAGSRGWRGLDRELVAIVQRSLQAKTESEADFWSVAGEIEMRQYEALAGKRLSASRRGLVKAYQDLHTRVTATRMWASVYDTACLVLPNYADRGSGKERETAMELLELLRTFAHPEGQ